LKLDEACRSGVSTRASKARHGSAQLQSIGYDPQSDAITSAWNTAINEYLHKDLKYATQETYLLSGRQGGNDFSWNMTHIVRRVAASAVVAAAGWRPART
jgi:hypothetical protein